MIACFSLIEYFGVDCFGNVITATHRGTLLLFRKFGSSRKTRGPAGPGFGGQVKPMCYTLACSDVGGGAVVKPSSDWGYGR